jgi:outer membrane immunogenic protein
MIKTLLAGTALFLVPFGAGAADLPVRTPAPAPVVAAPIFTWSGVYMGVQGGWQQQRDHYSDDFVAVPAGQAPPGAIDPSRGFASFGTTKKNGFIGGAHAGYNHQIGSLVVGVEADIEGTNLKYGYQDKFSPIDGNGPQQIPVGGIWGYNARIGVQGSLRARIGYAFDKALLYATGGLAVADVSHTIYDEGDPAFSHKFSDVPASNLRSPAIGRPAPSIATPTLAASART